MQPMLPLVMDCEDYLLPLVIALNNLEKEFIVMDLFIHTLMMASFVFTKELHIHDGLVIYHHMKDRNH